MQQQMAKHIILAKPIVVCIIFFMIASTSRGKFRSLFVLLCWKSFLHHCSYFILWYINILRIILNIFSLIWLIVVLDRRFYQTILMKFVLRLNQVLHKCIFEDWIQVFIMYRGSRTLCVLLLLFSFQHNIISLHILCVT